LPSPPHNITQKQVLVVAAGNIPLVGFHDLICVLASGKRVVLKLSKDDESLMKYFISILIQAMPELEGRIRIEPHIVGAFDAAIATGSNNSLRYFEYYFRNKPQLLRGHRNSAAVISGKESPEDLALLGEDVFAYYGLGCRSVSLVFIPESFDLQNLFEAWFPFSDVMQNTRYANNYHYHRTLMLLNQVPFLENGFLMLRASETLHSPVGVVHYFKYRDKNHLQQMLANNTLNLQCITGLNFIPFGNVQKPELWDYADHINTLEFLDSIT
jgi:hypothetical protein